MDRSVFAEMAATDETLWWYKARRSIISELITKQIKPKPDANILEVGCGTGSNLKLLSSFGPLTAIEPDEEAMAFAATRAKATLLQGFLPDKMPVPDKGFDMAAMLDVLEHIDDDLGALRGVQSKLKPGACLLITVPALPILWSKHDEAHHHKRRYTPKTLRAVIQESGFKLEQMSYFNTLLFPMIAGVRALKALTKDESADTGIPPKWLNGLLEVIFGCEKHLVGRIPLPIGVSLYAIVRAPA